MDKKQLKEAILGKNQEPLPATPTERLDDMSVDLKRLSARQIDLRQDLAELEEQVAGHHRAIAGQRQATEHMGQTHSVISNQIERLEFETRSQQATDDLTGAKVDALTKAVKAQGRTLQELKANRFTVTHLLLLLAIASGIFLSATHLFVATSMSNPTDTTYYPR